MSSADAAILAPAGLSASQPPWLKCFYSTPAFLIVVGPAVLIVAEHDEHDRYTGQLDWQPYRAEHKTLPINPLKKRKGHAFFSAYYAPKLPYDEEVLFWPEGFYALEDLLASGGNTIECGLIAGGVAMFRVTPVAPDCGKPYPVYAEIAGHLPTDLHYFTKFADADFRLVTETFVQRVEQMDLKGFRFVLRWDGKRSYPRMCWE